MRSLFRFRFRFRSSIVRCVAPMVIGLFVLPFNASALLIAIDYAGTVDSVDGHGAGYTVGDAIAGSLVIDTGQVFLRDTAGAADIFYVRDDKLDSMGKLQRSLDLKLIGPNLLSSVEPEDLLIDFQPNSEFRSYGQVYSNTGLVGGYSWFSLTSLRVAPVAVPEPGLLLLLSGGFLALGFAGRQRLALPV